MKNGGIKQRINRYFAKHWIDQSEILWLLRCQLFVVLFSIALVTFFGSMIQCLSFLIGALLSSFNLCVLARLVPQLIWIQKGAVFALLFSFYLRLLFTAVILLLALVFLKLSAFFLLTGFSTIIVTLVLGIGMYIFTLKHEKEA